jgi:hypothetical protein
MMSSLISWSGKHYHVPVGGSISEFTSRVPAPTETALYKLENEFYTCASLTGLPMCLVGVGLLYGGHGYDFHNLFKYVTNPHIQML